MRQVKIAKKYGMTPVELSKALNGHYKSLPGPLAGKLSKMLDLPVEQVVLQYGAAPILIKRRYMEKYEY